MKSVVVISDRHSVHARLRRALVEDGWDVLDCPGPPTCAPEGVCDLAKVSDAVVLDTDVAGPLSAWALYLRYIALDVPIVVLVDQEEVHAWKGDRERTLVLPRDVDPKTVARAIRDAIAHAAAHQPLASANGKAG